MNNEELITTQERYHQLMRDKDYKEALELNAQLHKEFSDRFSKLEEPERQKYKLRMTSLDVAALALNGLLGKDIRLTARKIQGEAGRN